MADFRIRVVVDPRTAEPGLRRVEGRLGKTNEAADRLRRTIARAFTFAGAALATRQLLSLADTYNQVENRLRTVVEGQGELNRTLDELFDIASRTRTEVESVVALYQRGSIAAKELGASQEEMLTFVERVGQALAVQGGSAASASGALTQLSQSLSSGIVRAEEFNSILEGAFPIAQAAAKGIDAAGGSVGRLRQLIVDGKVTSEEFFRGFLEGSRDIERQFGRTVPTVGQSMTTLRNELVRAVGVLDDATGASRGLAESLQSLAGVLREVVEQIKSGQGPIGTLAELMRNASFRAEELHDQLDEDSRSLAGLGANLRLAETELRRLEQRAATLEVVPQSVLDRMELLRERIAAARGEAAKGFGLGPIHLVEGEGVDLIAKAQAAIAKAQEERARSLEHVLRGLRDEEELNQLLLAGRRDLAEALEVELSLRQMGVRIGAEERATVLQTVQRAQATRDLVQALDDLVGPQEDANRQLEAMNRLLEEHPELAVQAARAMDELRLAGLETATDLSSGFERAFLRMRLEANDFASAAERAVGAFADNATDALATFVRTGQFSFHQFADALLDDLARILARLLVVQTLSALGGAAGIIPPAIPTRQFGGPLLPNVPTLVGEDGPELVVSRQAMHVVPNDQLMQPRQEQQPPPEVNVAGPNIVVVEDKSLVPDAISRGDADRAIVIALQRNRGKIKQILG